MPSLMMTTFSPLTDASPRTRMMARSCDISGQCSKCFDFFTVTVLLVRGQPSIRNTARMEWHTLPDEGAILIHRPGLCNGKIKLYGSLEKLSHDPHHALHHVIPRSDAAPAHK